MKNNKGYVKRVFNVERTFKEKVFINKLCCVDYACDSDKQCKNNMDIKNAKNLGFITGCILFFMGLLLQHF